MQTLLWSFLSATFDMRFFIDEEPLTKNVLLPLTLTCASSTFDMRFFIDLSETFFAVDAYQQLLILLTNGVHADRTEINQGILELGNHICTTGTDLVQLQSDFYAY